MLKSLVWPHTPASPSLQVWPFKYLHIGNQLLWLNIQPSHFPTFPYLARIHTAACSWIRPAALKAAHLPSIYCWKLVYKCIFHKVHCIVDWAAHALPIWVIFAIGCSGQPLYKLIIIVVIMVKGNQNKQSSNEGGNNRHCSLYGPNSGHNQAHIRANATFLSSRSLTRVT